MARGCWLKKPDPATQRPVVAAPSNNDGEASWDDLQPVDQLGLELGYRLIALVDKSRQGDLLSASGRATQVSHRRSDSFHPRSMCATTSNSKPSAYRITLRGVVVGEGEHSLSMYLAINPGGITTPLIPVPPPLIPAFGLPCHWIDEQQRKACKWSAIRWLIPDRHGDPFVTRWVQSRATAQSDQKPVGGARDHWPQVD